MMAKAVRRDEIATERIEEWLGGLELQGVFLGGVQLELNREESPRPSDKLVTQNSSTEVQLQSTDSMLKAVVSFCVEAVREEGLPSYFKLTGTYDLLFRGDEKVAQASDEYSAELAKVAVVVAWPYIRETVDGMAARARTVIPPLPPITRRLVSDESVSTEG
jgi:hypothetical protein